MRIEPLEDRSLLSATLPSGGLTPAQIEHAYGFDLIQFAGGVHGDGSGQTIAIVDEFDDPNIASDLHALRSSVWHRRAFRVLQRKWGSTRLATRRARFRRPLRQHGIGDRNVDGRRVGPRACAGANIVLVEANSDEQIVTAMGAAANISGVSVVSLSFGAPESDAQSSSLGWYPAFETIGSQHPGVTFVVSSGDEHNGEMVDYPSTSTWALSVGGAAFYATSLR